MAKPPFCWHNLYGTGQCCKDKHFDPREVLPAMEGALCKADPPDFKLTTDKQAVSCKDCIELLHS